MAWQPAQDHVLLTQGQVMNHQSSLIVSLPLEDLQLYHLDLFQAGFGFDDHFLHLPANTLTLETTNPYTQ